MTGPIHEGIQEQALLPLRPENIHAETIVCRFHCGNGASLTPSAFPLISSSDVERHFPGRGLAVGKTRRRRKSNERGMSTSDLVGFFFLLLLVTWFDLCLVLCE